MSTGNPLDDMPTLAEMEASRRRRRRHRVILCREVTACAESRAAVGEPGNLGPGLVLGAIHEEGRLRWQLEHDMGNGSLTWDVTFCPWCGERLPEKAESPEAGP
jgi:hypothetical protein